MLPGDSDKPLPCKLLITKTGDATQVSYSETYRWNLNPQFSAGEFTFRPGKDDARIPFVKSTTKQ